MPPINSMMTARDTPDPFSHLVAGLLQALLQNKKFHLKAPARVKSLAYMTRSVMFYGHVNFSKLKAITLKPTSSTRTT